MLHFLNRLLGNHPPPGIQNADTINIARTHEVAIGEITSDVARALAPSAFGATNNRNVLGCQGLELYRDMLEREPMLQAPFQEVITSVIAPGWQVLGWDDDDPESEAATKLVRWCLEHLGGRRWVNGRRVYHHTSMEHVLTSLLGALQYGFSIAELIWDYEYVPGLPERPSGRYLTLHDVKFREPWRFSFDLDEHGNITEHGIIERIAGAEPREHPTSKFIVFSYLRQFENVYGTSALRPLYRNFTLANLAWRMRTRLVQRAAGGVVVAEIPNAVRNNTAFFDSLKDALRKMSRDGFIDLPEGVMLKAVDLASSSASEFQAVTEALIKEAYLCLTGQMLSSTDATRTGNLATAREHAATKERRFAFIRKCLESAVNEQIVRPLVEANFATESIPRFRIASTQSRTVEEELAILSTLHDLGATPPPTHLLDRYGFPSAAASQP